MSLPKGVNESVINLKCCNPNGIPMIVTQNKMPNTRCVRAIHIPPTSIHIMFITTDRHPGSPGASAALWPNGHRARKPSLNAWTPNGIPIMVTHISIPAIMYSSESNRPPKTIHIIFYKYFHYNVLYIPNAGYLKKQVQDLRAFLILTTYSFLRTSRGMEFIVWRRLRRVLEGSSMTAFSIFSIDFSLMRMELPHI